MGILAGDSSAMDSSPAVGPLRVSKDNPRYFADSDGKIVYMTGSHTWSNFKDMGNSDPPPVFNYDVYLDFMQQHNHNFMRMWTWELTKYSYDGPIYGTLTYADPFPWMRTGVGTALDGKPKFDLSKLNQAYFNRLRERVISAGEKGIYVSIMLFEGHGIHASLEPWCWNGHPLNANNNVNGINGDPNGDGRGLEVHTLQMPEVTKIQKAYMQKVIDTVNDLDNVLYEVANESGAYSTEWQYYMINYIHDYEKTKPKQHPVGMTFQYAGGNLIGKNANLFDSPAEWISPNPEGGYRDNPPVADGSKVIINDTDHLWGIGGNQAWVWKSFCRGMNPIFMDPYSEAKKEDKQQTTWTNHLSDGTMLDPKWNPIRKSMGYTRSYAMRMNMASAVPRNDLASTQYCLANPGVEYLVYLPDGGEVTVDLSGNSGDFAVEWFDPSTGVKKVVGTTAGDEKQLFVSPFDGDAVLYIFNEAKKSN